MSGLYTGVSGLQAAQAGLYVLGHNISNTNTTGYTRQRMIQHDFSYRTVGSNGNGAMQVGLGAGITSIQQIRDRFLDMAYREEVSKGSFYGIKSQVGSEIEAILGELQGEYNAQSIIEDMWRALNELSISQGSLETRANFISTCVSFVKKADNVFNRLIEYQYNLDQQVRDSVKKINELVEKINTYNDKIMQAETSGDHANDYRDVRNQCLDELSQYIKIDYTENAAGRVDIQVNGRELLVAGSINKLGLKYTSGNYSFVEPVFTSSTSILSCDANPGTYRTLYDLTGPVDSEHENDSGSLLALLATRGYTPANYATEPVRPVKTPGMTDGEYRQLYLQYQKEVFNCNDATIPRLQKQFDTLVNSIVKMINEAFAPADPADPNTPAPYDMSDPPVQTCMEIFVRKYMDRYDGNGDYNEDTPDNYYSLYTIGNIKINPALLNTTGYTMLALSASGSIDDNTIMKGLMKTWKSGFIQLGTAEPLSVDDAYKQIITNVAVETDEAIGFTKEQTILVTQINNKRQERSGVSLDEELTSMLIYQHAYNAASRVINTIDGMMDRVINGTGRAGM